MRQEDTLEIRSAVINDATAGCRLDIALTVLFPSLSRRDAQRFCTEGRVLINGKIAKKSALVQTGDPVTITPGRERVAVPSPGPLQLRLITEHWVVVAKPPLQPTAPKHSEETETLANALVATFPEMANIGHRSLEPGLLHRLDNGTSGLLVAARTLNAFERATVALKQSRWSKSYFAILEAQNLPEVGRLIGELEPCPGQRQKVRPKSAVTLIPGSFAQFSAIPLGPAETRFETLATQGPMSLVRVFVGPAFRHQIRAHFAAIGAPLVNDEIYGAPRDLRLATGRHALHAARVAWAGEPPLEGFDVTEPLARDLAAFFDDECA